MVTQPGTASVRLEQHEPAPVEAPVGSTFAVRLRASCASGHDRSGMLVMLVAPDGSQSSHPLLAHNGESSETGEILLRVPARTGDHVWRFVLPPHAYAGGQHGEATLDVSVRATPQGSSLAAWDIPSPVVAGTDFTIKVGAKSAADCDLRGRVVQVLRNGGVVAHAALGDTPLPGTAALYWAELNLTAPAASGIASWTAQFEPDGLDLPHESATSAFDVAVVPPLEHTLTVRVIEKETASPIEEALVRLGAYRAQTGRAGLAEVRLPKGRYELSVWKAGYEIEAATLDFDRNTSIEVAAVPIPEEDPDARWKM